MIWQLPLAGVLGGVVGATELGARYRDDPLAALRTLPGVLYVVVNAMAAIAALVIVEAFGWTFGLGSDASALQVDVIQVLVAGIGSAALFRSSLFTVRQGDQEIGIGPSAVLAALLGQVDRGVDRRRALERLKRDDLAGLSFDRDYVALTELCVGALQNLDKADAQALGELAARLKEEPRLSDPEKLDCFALKLLTLVGPKTIQAAAERLRERDAVEHTAPAELADPAEPTDAAAQRVPMSLPSEQSGTSREAAAWRKRLNALESTVTRPLPADGQLDAGLEAAWLHDRLEEPDEAAELYKELREAIQRISSLTDHEVTIEWIRLSVAHRGLTGIESEFYRDLLASLCLRPGGRHDSYVVAHYMLARLHMLARRHESVDDRSLSYITAALELLPACQSIPYHDFSCLSYATRACCYLSRGDAKAAADDLALVSETKDRNLQIISGSLCSLLQAGLPDEQARALWLVVRPFGFWSFRERTEYMEHEVSEYMGRQVLEVSGARVMTVGVREYMDKDENGKVLDWYRDLAQNLKRHMPELIRETPLRTFDLIRSDQIQFPERSQPLLLADLRGRSQAQEEVLSLQPEPPRGELHDATRRLPDVPA